MTALSLPAQLKTRDTARRAAYAAHLKLYNGDQWNTTNPRKARRLTYNYIRAILTKATSYLMTGRSPTVEPDDDTDQAVERASAIETAIFQVWNQNNIEQLDFDTELDAAVLGDGVYKVRWDFQDEHVRISAPDPSTTFAWHLPDDTSRFWRVASQYELDQDSAQHVLGHLNFTGFKKTNTITEVWTDATFDLYVNDSLADQKPNPYGFIPFVIFPNIREPKQLWGTSDVLPLIDTQRELNRALTQLSHILELSGNPVAVLENVNEAQDIAVQPGAVWELPEKSKAYLLDLLEHGGVKLHIDYIDAIYRTLHDLGETPRSAFGGGDNTALSGVALELELDPIIKKIERKRLIRTAAYRTRNEMIIALLDRFAGTEFGHANHDIAWGTVLPTDREREVQSEIGLVAAGIHSRRHAADELGDVDDPESEFSRWLDEESQVLDATTHTTPQ